MSYTKFSIQQIVLRSHLWLGICATLCTWGTFVLLHQPISVVYLLFVFCGTVTIYSFHGYFTIREREKASPGYLIITLIGGCIGTLALYLLLPPYKKFILLFPSLISIFYVFPLLGEKRLKDFPFIKIAAIVFAWTTITFWIPAHTIPYWWEEPGYRFLLIDRLLFFFALAIPFDIRDMTYDKNRSLRTIPNTIGRENSQFLALFSLFLAGGFMTMGGDLAGIGSEIRIGILATYMLAGILIIRLKKIPNASFYSWYIDGILFVYGIVVLFLSG